MLTVTFYFYTHYPLPITFVLVLNYLNVFEQICLIQHFNNNWKAISSTCINCIKEDVW